MWRFRWRALAVAWFLAVVGWAWIACAPNIYSASARVHVDTESALRPLPARSRGRDEHPGPARFITARPVGPSAAREGRAGDGSRSARAHAPGDGDDRRGPPAKILISGAGSGSIYTISYEDATRWRSGRADAARSRFVETSLGDKRSDSTSAQRFLEGSDQGLRAALERGGGSPGRVQKKHVGMMPDDGGDYYGASRRERDARDPARRPAAGGTGSTRSAAGTDRQRVGRRSVSVQAPSNGATMTLDTKITEYERQLADLRLRFTDKHPDI